MNQQSSVPNRFAAPLPQGASRKVPGTFRRGVLAFASLALVLPACSGQAVAPPSVVSAASTHDASALPPRRFWSEPMQSPRPARAITARDAVLYAICGEPDEALQQAARVVIDRVVSGRGAIDADELNFTLEALGDPHVWPRSWTVTGEALDEGTIAERLAKFVKATSHVVGVRRCGIARDASVQGEDSVAVVVIDALADVDPVPTVMQIGQRVTVQASLLVPASAAAATIIGPGGALQRVPVALSGSTLRFQFAPEQAGAWVIEVTATPIGGPRPILQFIVHAGAEPPQHYIVIPSLGEDAGAGVTDPAEALTRMINAARAVEGVPLLQRDSTLDALARAHSEQMMTAHRVAHDLGQGDPAIRLQAGGIRATAIGENIVRARSTEGIHRALWRNPFERMNMVTPRFKRLGVWVAVDQDGEKWATELFTD